MGFNKKTTISSDKILTVIGKDTLITGTLHGSGPLRIDGRVEGEVNVDGDIIIGKDAKIEAQVKGTNIQVAGKITGNVEATGKLEILASGIIDGDVKVHTMQVDDGAVLRGNCSMQRTTEKKEKK
ncbi:MAG: polymer-forming cytoskeletal protein [Bacillota bacterium]|nr:polymer-forming cytoskeletal protein [Bacillota bacterium]MDW7682743.1 polymer-forming cytoskeletal protein [Bacillota bacterium]